MLPRRVLGATALLLAAGAAGLAPGSAAPGPAVPASAEEGPARVMLVLDSSRSMMEPVDGGQPKVEAVQAGLRSVIDGLPEDAEVGVRVFGAGQPDPEAEDACQDTQVVVPPGSGNRDDLRSAVADLAPTGGRPTGLALGQAAVDLGDEGTRTIVLVSDGAATCEPDPCAVARGLADDGLNLHVDVVGLSVTGAARDQLRCIAEAGNGTYVDADAAADIAGALGLIGGRATSPFVLDGRPIEGGPIDRPTRIKTGDWTDRIVGGENSRSYSFKRFTRGTILRASAHTQGEHDDSEFLTVEIYTGQGVKCDYNLAQRALDTRSIIGAGSTASPANGCGSPGRYRITVSRTVDEGESVPFGLRITEEPARTEPGLVARDAGPAVAPDVGGTPRPVEGGSSFADAPTIGTGRWSSAVTPGDAALFAIPLEFGQSARIRVLFPPLTPERREASAFYPPLARLTLYSPMLAQVPLMPGSDYSANAAGETMLTATGTVSAADTEPPGDFDGGGDYTTAGHYYVGVAVEREDYAVEFPFRLTVEVVGEPAEGPSYVDGVSWSVEDDLAAAGRRPHRGPSEPDWGPDDDEPSISVGVVRVVGALALAVGLALHVGWRRRVARSPITTV